MRNAVSTDTSRRSVLLVPASFTTSAEAAPSKNRGPWLLICCTFPARDGGFQLRLPVPTRRRPTRCFPPCSGNPTKQPALRQEHQAQQQLLPALSGRLCERSSFPRLFW